MLVQRLKLCGITGHRYHYPYHTNAVPLWPHQTSGRGHQCPYHTNAVPYGPIKHRAAGISAPIILTPCPYGPTKHRAAGISAPIILTPCSMTLSHNGAQASLPCWGPCATPSWARHSRPPVANTSTCCVCTASKPHIQRLKGYFSTTKQRPVSVYVLRAYGQ